jgi:hypothetical protein
MTVVIARRFGERVRLLSDTMISDRAAVRANIIPGTLKALVIDRFVSIAFAGDISTAMEAIANASAAYSAHRDLDALIDQLHRAGRANLGTQRACDFIIVGHVRGAEIFRILDGQIMQAETGTFIGDGATWAYIRSLETSLPIDGEFGTDEYSSPEERRFDRAATRLRFAPAEHASAGVGGFLIPMLCSPYGHCYTSEAGVHAWDEVHIPGGLTPQQIADRASGQTQFSYHMIAPRRRGVAVVGAFLEQAQVGYIYSPMRLQGVQSITSATLQLMHELVEAEAETCGGQLVAE